MRIGVDRPDAEIVLRIALQVTVCKACGVCRDDRDSRKRNSVERAFNFKSRLVTARVGPIKPDLRT